MNTNYINLKIKKILNDSSKKIISKLLFPIRNHFLLYNISNIAKKNQVNLNYWLESANLGDILSPIIVYHMLALKKIHPNKEIKGTKHLYAVGSVLTAGIQDCTVWGSGVLNACLTYRLKGRKLDIRAVRGPFTRSVLMDYGFDVPEVYGDPAILLPEIYTPKNIRKVAKYGLIMHKDDQKNVSEFEDVAIIDIKTSNYKSFVDQLHSVDIVVSSSLHGIIIAESYGINAILLRPKIDILKYYDWYYSTKRLHFPIANSIADAKTLVAATLPELDNMRVKLKEAFPYDLYN